jgi:hypothetical protein
MNKNDITSRNIKDGSILKGLQTQLNKAEGEFESLKLQQNDLIGTIQHKKRQIEEMKNKITILQTTKKIVVSEHAIFRYLERVEKMDINTIIEKIVPEHIREMVEYLGSGSYPVDGKFSIKVKNNVVTTITV